MICGIIITAAVALNMPASALTQKTGRTRARTQLHKHALRAVAFYSGQRRRLLHTTTPLCAAVLWCVRQQNNDSTPTTTIATTFAYILPHCRKFNAGSCAIIIIISARFIAVVVVCRCRPFPALCGEQRQICPQCLDGFVILSFVIALTTRRV